MRSVINIQEEEKRMERQLHILRLIDDMIKRQGYRVEKMKFWERSFGCENTKWKREFETGQKALFRLQQYYIKQNHTI